MKEIDEMDHLMAVWQSETPQWKADDLGRLVRRQGFWMKVHTAAGLGLAVAFFAGSFYAAVRQPNTEFVVMAIGIWMVTLSTLIYSFSNQAGTWKAEGNSTREFLELSMRRCRARLRSVRFGLWLVAMETVLIAAWHAWYWSSRPGRPSMAEWLVAALIPVGFVVALLMLRSRNRDQLSNLEQIERELSSDF